jgi:hypothetical protein
VGYGGVWTGGRGRHLRRSEGAAIALEHRGDREQDGIQIYSYGLYTVCVCVTYL